jgi:hypothetical protein
MLAGDRSDYRETRTSHVDRLHRAMHGFATMRFQGDYGCDSCARCQSMRPLIERSIQEHECHGVLASGSPQGPWLPCLLCCVRAHWMDALRTRHGCSESKDAADGPDSICDECRAESSRGTWKIFGFVHQIIPQSYFREAPSPLRSRRIRRHRQHHDLLTVVMFRLLQRHGCLSHHCDVCKAAMQELVLPTLAHWEETSERGVPSAILLHSTLTRLLDPDDRPWFETSEPSRESTRRVRFQDKDSTF